MFVVVLVMLAEIEVSSSWDLSEYDLFDVRPGFAVSDDGHVALADVDERQIVLIDNQGELVGRFGRKGMGPGEFGNIWFIRWSTARQCLAVLDWGNKRLALWTLQGLVLNEYKIVDFIPDAALVEADSLIYPVNRYARDGDPALVVLDFVTGASKRVWAHKPEQRGTVHAFKISKGFPVIAAVAWHPKLLFARGSDFFAVTYGAAEKVEIIDFQGNTLATLDPRLPRFPLTDAHVAEQLPGYTPAKRKKVESLEKRPEYQPVTQSLLVDARDRIWSFGYASRAGGPVPFRVFDRTGVVLSEDEIEGAPSAVHHNTLYVLNKTEDGDFVLRRISYPLAP